MFSSIFHLTACHFNTLHRALGMIPAVLAVSGRSGFCVANVMRDEQIRATVSSQRREGSRRTAWTEGGEQVQACGVVHVRGRTAKPWLIFKSSALRGMSEQFQDLLFKKDHA